MKGDWFVEEDEHTWCLYFLPVGGMMQLQIIKAAKKGTPYAEYWPTKEETQFILKALNKESMLYKGGHDVDEFYRD